jgi:hypothetical protein
MNSWFTSEMCSMDMTLSRIPQTLKLSYMADHLQGPRLALMVLRKD